MSKKIRLLAAMLLALCLLATQFTVVGATTETDKIRLMEAAGELQLQNEAVQEAETKISKEEASKIFKAFKFIEGYNITNITFENGYNLMKPTWRAELSGFQMNTSGSLSISADTGELVNYKMWSSNQSKNIVTITKKKAKEVADKFISENVKTENKNLVYIPKEEYIYEKTGGIRDVPQYEFSYVQKVNNIIAPEITYNISVNASNGKVSGFYTPYELMNEEIKYPSAKGIKDIEQLKSKYTGMINMQLQYTISDSYDKPEVSQVYIPVIDGFLDAKTMNIVKDPILKWYGNSSKKYDQMVPGAKVQTQAINETQGAEIIEKARKYIEKTLNIKLQESKNSSFRIGGLQNQYNKIYDLRLDNENIGLSISVNLDTGNIYYLSFSRYKPYESDIGSSAPQKEVTPKVSYEDAKKTSDKIIKELFPNQYGAFCDNNSKNNQIDGFPAQVYTFMYPRVENGIFTNDSINIVIDNVTGNIKNININWHDLDFPKPTDIISSQDAKKTYIQNIDLNLEYYTPYTYSEKGRESSGDTRIVLKPREYFSYFIDAKTGKQISWDGSEIQKRVLNENHWAADSIEMLIAQGTFSGNIPDYDQKLSRQEAVKMLSLTIGIQNFIYSQPASKDSFSDINKESEYYNYIESAVQNGIIKATGNSFNGTEKITKKEYVSLLINLLGYEEIAKHSELFANADNINISICRALNILPVSPEAAFNADDTITVGEAAYSLQKALKYIR